MHTTRVCIEHTAYSRTSCSTRLADTLSYCVLNYAYNTSNIIILLLKDCLASLNGVFTTKDRYSSEPFRRRTTGTVLTYVIQYA